MGAPILNEYKRSFLFKRLPQTLFGGLKVKLGYSVPLYIYVNQVALWLVPFLLGSLFTLVLELAYTDKQISDFLLLYSCVYGACMIIFVVIVQIIATVTDMKQKSDPQLGKVKKTKNTFAEEDEIVFESCCGPETIAFVIPKKKFKINIAVHALASGAVCGLGYWYLLPYSLNHLFSYNYGATAVIYIMGWLTVCIAQYSLTTTAPPEPAVYRTMDAYETQPLTRPFYTLLCYSIHIVNWYYLDFQVANQVLHVLFVLLPLLWFSGCLPPWEVLLLWVIEQYHVFLLGGSPAASIPRLLVNVGLSTCVFLGCYFLSSCFGAVILSALTGYLLSCDLGALGTQIWSAYQRCSKNKISAARPAFFTFMSSPQPSLDGFLWSWCWSTLLYHLFMTAIATVAAAVTNYHASSISSSAFESIGYCIIALCVIEKALREFQHVFVFFGLWRNAFYPQYTETLVDFPKKGKLWFLGVLRRIINYWVTPVLMVVFLSLKEVTGNAMSVSCFSDMSTTQSVFATFAMVRAYRWVWQSTTHSVLEMAVVYIILMTVPEDSTILNLQVPVILLIICVVRDRLCQLIKKLFFFIFLIITSLSDKKKCQGSTTVMLFTVVFFPLALVSIIVSSALSAPLLCLFTLPFVFIGYPRPCKFWPEPIGASFNTCSDSVYYKQLSRELAIALRLAFANGSMGEPEAGNHYLARFQDRLVWVMVLERGAGFCTVNIKGLELQETTCHATEAVRIDHQFTEAFESGRSLCSFNSFPLHCLTPLDSAVMKTYSDAKNVLTGVIDSPDNLGLTLSFFAKSLIWVLLHHVNKIKRREEDNITNVKVKEGKLKNNLDHVDSKDNEGDFSSDGKGEVNVVNNNTTYKELDHNMVSPSTDNVLKISSSIRKVSHGENNDNFVQTFVDGTRTNKNSHPASRESNTSKNSSISSLHSFTDSIWSDDADQDKKKLGSLKQKNKVSTVGPLVHRQPENSVFPLQPPAKLNKISYGAFNDRGDGKGIDSFLNDMEFGLPAVDVNTSLAHQIVNFEHTCQPVGSQVLKLSSQSTKAVSYFMVANGNLIYKPVMNLASSPDFKCPYSSHISVPLKWRELPIEPSQLLHYMAQFPVSWYKHTLHCLNWSGTGQLADKVAAELSADDALTNCYSQLVMACYSAFDSPGRPAGASYLFKSYNGDVPWNAMMDWLSENKELYRLVIRAFRYGFKLMLDQTLLGDISNNEELEATLRSYDQDWYIGKETDVDWGRAVMENRRNLFSLDQNIAQGTYTSRSLSLQDIRVHIGRINRESVIGQWANLNLELLYMTNDDEERYSIQAQPRMLRNLTVQAADPPLGYPIYSSPPISVPTL